MKRYLFTTLPSNDLGLFTRSLPIARELAEFKMMLSFYQMGSGPTSLAPSGVSSQGKRQNITVRAFQVLVCPIFASRQIERSSNENYHSYQWYQR
jgi:hypothetical protein